MEAKRHIDSVLGTSVNTGAVEAGKGPHHLNSACSNIFFAASARERGYYKILLLLFYGYG